jgi:alanyl-tRNA synthetase
MCLLIRKLLIFGNNSLQKITYSWKQKMNFFWEMGRPRTLRFLNSYRSAADGRRAVSGKSLVNADHPQVVEIWNNVFMEFNRKSGWFP